MKIIQTDQLDKYELLPGSDESLHVYNGFDCCLPIDLADILLAKIDEQDLGHIYNYERSMMGPAYQMMRRGFRIDHEDRLKLIDELTPVLYRLGGMQKKGKSWKITDENAVIQRIAKLWSDKPINYNSHKQLKEFLYDHLEIPTQYKFEKGKKKISVDRDTLERLAPRYPRVRLFVKVLLAIRDIEKNLGVLNSTLDEDERFRCAYNVGGTDTGRWNSRTTYFDTGSNLQNVTSELRRVFIPDPGKVMFYADLNTAESLGVGFLSGDEAYKKACTDSDLHTVVARLVWSKLSWSGDIEKDKELAERPFYRGYSRRFMCKRGGHGSNYMGTPRTLGMQMKVEEKEIKRFQALYFGGDLTKTELERWGYYDELYDQGEWEGEVLHVTGAFPGIRRWQEDTIHNLQLDGHLTNALGRKRVFWGRLWDAATHRKAIAFLPQSLISDILNIGLWRIYDRLPEVELLANGHDAVCGQIPVEMVDELGPKILECMKVAVPFGDEFMTIGVSINFGQNWRDCSD